MKWWEGLGFEGARLPLERTMPVNEQLQYCLDHPDEPCGACEHPIRDHLEGGKVVRCKGLIADPDPGCSPVCGCGMEC